MAKIRQKTEATTTRGSRRDVDTTDYSEVVKKIKPISSLGLVLAALFYGKSGSGKTTVGATFPGPILHQDIREKGTDSISNIPGAKTVSVDHWDEWEQLYWFLKSGDHDFKTVIVDAVTQLQALCMAKVREDEDRDEKEVISKRMWGQISGLLQTWIVNYRDLVDMGINVVFLAHTRENEEQEGEDDEIIPHVGPRTMPSVASILTAAVKLTGNTFIRERWVEPEEGQKKKRRVVDYCMRIGPHGFFETKVRVPKGTFVPDIIVDPDYDKLIQIMKGEYPDPSKSQGRTTQKHQPVRKLQRRR